MCLFNYVAYAFKAYFIISVLPSVQYLTGLVVTTEIEMDAQYKSITDKMRFFSTFKLIKNKSLSEIIHSCNI